jgi:hypothetical protein
LKNDEVGNWFRPNLKKIAAGSRMLQKKAAVPLGTTAFDQQYGNDHSTT